MSGVSVAGLTWGQRFAIIDHYKPDDEQIIAGLQISQVDLESARGLLGAGTIQVTKDIDVKKYEGIFISPSAPATTAIATTTQSTELATVDDKSTELATVDDKSPEPAQTATNPAAVPKKRGRKGSKIKNAFALIPSEPTSITAFATDNDVSINVLKQSSRFDHLKANGRVRTKTEAESGNLLIWREKIEESAQESAQSE